MSLCICFCNRWWNSIKRLTETFIPSNIYQLHTQETTTETKIIKLVKFTTTKCKIFRRSFQAQPADQSLILVFFPQCQLKIKFMYDPRPPISWKYSNPRKPVLEIISCCSTLVWCVNSWDDQCWLWSSQATTMSENESIRWFVRIFPSSMCKILDTVGETVPSIAAEGNFYVVYVYCGSVFTWLWLLLCLTSDLNHLM